MMACVTNRNVHPGLIFYDMHAVLRDLDRAAAAEARREREADAVKRAGDGRLGGYAEEVAAAMRRRKEVRRPRVRVRVDHGEARLLADGSPEAERLLALARELIGEPPAQEHRKEPRDAG